MEQDIEAFGPVLLFLAACVGFVVAALAAAHLIPKIRKSTPVKDMPYESGMDPEGDARQHFDVKFYLVAILFLVFDVELLFLYPWACAAFPPVTGGSPDTMLLPDALRTPVFVTFISFLATLALGYVYAWWKGVFEWR